jgi:pimeloyl-ACP methyl ester carboxylesterase
MIVEQPLVFGDDPGLAGVLTEPGVRGPRGVVVCSPFGHPNVCSYRPLRTLARRIAESGGGPVLRFDWPGVGESGDPAEVDSWPALWIDAVSQAVDELRLRTGVDEVTLAGLRIGGTLALAAALERVPGVTALALLAPYASGRTYLRELRAFNAASQGLASAPEQDSEPLPPGALEASGFLVSAEEVDALRSLDILQLDPAPLAGRRILLVTGSDRGATTLADWLRSAGAELRSEIARDLVHAWEGTSTSIMPRSVSSLVCDWLTEHESPGVGTPAPCRRRPRATLDGDGWRERPVVLETDEGRLVGTVCEPTSFDPAEEWLVFLNAGRVRRMGPNRLMTTFARAWAQRGLPSLRLDLPGIGDSDGAADDDEVHVPYDAGWYGGPTFTAGAAAALSWLAQEHSARRFAFVGLCSGAGWGFDLALADTRVASVALLNPRHLHEDGRAASLDALATVARIVRHPRTLASLRGHGLRDLPRLAATGALLTVTGRGKRAWQHDRLLESLSELRERGTRLTIAFSDGDPGIGYFTRHLGPDWRRQLARHGVTVEVIHGPDHTFRPLWSHGLLQAAVERHLGSIAFLPAPKLDAIR